MEPNKKINFLAELQESIGTSVEYSVNSLTNSYELLHKFAGMKIIPLIQQKEITIATVELTTCGLLSDLLTGSSGASNFFILGITPYSNEMKIKLGLPRKELSFGGYGVVSPDAAKNLAKQIRDFSGAEVGLAETGLLTSSELVKRRTKKRAGEVFIAAASATEVQVRKLSIQSDLSRKYMRQEIAFRVLQFLQEFLS
ncbi:MAG: CinA family protein [Candidatus Heimdallarchaeota archaeon]|nr:MAG: CinA family protein [Candidatus Heimdallarchaeota archaeon]